MLDMITALTAGGAETEQAGGADTTAQNISAASRKWPTRWPEKAVLSFTLPEFGNTPLRKRPNKGTALAKFLSSRDRHHKLYGPVGLFWLQDHLLYGPARRATSLNFFPLSFKKVFHESICSYQRP
jgi:hypothetical protein